MKPFSLWVFIMLLTASLHAEIVTLTATAPAGSSNNTQLVVATNTVIQILHIRPSRSSGIVTIQKNNISFLYSKTIIQGDPQNKPILTGPATITVTAYDSNYPDDVLCTLSLTPQNQTETNQFTPNTGVVIPADSNGPVNIILESSVDLINWIPANPGTYGTTTTNRFFRVRATR